MTASRKLVISMNSWQESLWHRCTAHLWLDLCSQLTYHQNCFIRIVLSDLNAHHQYSSVILLLLSTKGRVLPTAPWCIHQSSRCIIIIIIEERWKPETTCGRDSDGYLERGIFRRSQVLLLFQLLSRGQLSLPTSNACYRRSQISSVVVAPAFVAGRAVTTNVKLQQLEKFSLSTIRGPSVLLLLQHLCSACHRQRFSFICSCKGRVCRSTTPASVATRTVPKIICVWRVFMKCVNVLLYQLYQLF